MPKIFTSKTQKIGELGESIAEAYLSRHGYKIIDRNYTIPQGEIDIVAQEDEEIVFVEVKAVSVSPETFENIKIGNMDVTRGTLQVNSLRNKAISAESVTHETNLDVTRGTTTFSDTEDKSMHQSTDSHKGHEMYIRPEDNMHPRKLQKLYRTIEIYLSDKDVPYDKKWRIDLLCVFLDIHSKRTKVEQYKNVNI